MKLTAAVFSAKHSSGTRVCTGAGRSPNSDSGNSSGAKSEALQNFIVGEFVEDESAGGRDDSISMNLVGEIDGRCEGVVVGFSVGDNIGIVEGRCDGLEGVVVGCFVARIPIHSDWV